VIKAATILPYDRSLNREGIAVDQLDGFFRVITPRVANWRTLSKWWYFSIGLMTLYSFLPLIGALMRQRPIQFEEIVITIEFTSILGIVLLAALVKLNHRYVFEISPNQFIVRRITFANMRRVWTFPREAVTDIHASAETGKLIVHVNGSDMMDIQLSRDRAIPDSVADALNRGLRETAVGGNFTTPAAPPDFSPRAKQAMFATCAGIVMVAILLGIFVHPAAILPALLSCAVPLGMAMGMQEKKFWT